MARRIQKPNVTYSPEYLEKIFKERDTSKKIEIYKFIQSLRCTSISPENKKELEKILYDACTYCDAYCIDLIQKSYPGCNINHCKSQYHNNALILLIKFYKNKHNKNNTIKKSQYIQALSSLLAFKNVDVNIQGEMGETAIAFAVKSLCPKEIFILLLKHKANPRIKNIYDKSAFSLAQTFRDIERKNGDEKKAKKYDSIIKLFEKYSPIIAIGAGNNKRTRILYILCCSKKTKPLPQSGRGFL